MWPNSDCMFLSWGNGSEPTTGVSAGNVPDSRRGQGGGMVVVVVAESLRQKLEPVYPWGKLLTS